MKAFDKIVEEIKKLSLSEKKELYLLLEKYMVEAGLDEIYSNFQEAKAEYKKSKPKFSSKIKDLKKSLD